MKKFISIIIAFALLISVSVPAFATSEHNPDECEHIPVIVVRGMDFGGLYVDLDTANEKPVLSLEADFIIKGILKVIASGIMNFSLDAAVDELSKVVLDIFKYFQMDENGDPLYNVQTPKFPESADNYENLRTGTDYEFGIVRTCIETFGDGHTYYFTYDWRLDPFVVADEIHSVVETAIATTGHDKVNIICCSMGGQMTLAYLTEYGYEKVERCLFMSSTFCGAQVASDLLNGRVKITSENLYNYLRPLSNNDFLTFLIDALYKIGLFDGLTKITDFILENYQDDVYQDAIIPIFSHMPALWGLVQAEDYESAINYVFGGRTQENEAFLARTDKIQKMMTDKTALIEEMIDSGVKVAIVAHYDMPLIPAYENAHFNGDSILETYQMSGYATVAPYGETLGDDYVAENPDYLSPDRVVDLSTALFPEYTYIIKGAYHVSGSYGTDYSDFIVWLLSGNGDFYAGANERYPQFMVSGSDQSLASF